MKMIKKKKELLQNFTINKDAFGGILRSRNIIFRVMAKVSRIVKVRRKKVVE